MWFTGVEVEQETSAPRPKKKILDPPLKEKSLYFILFLIVNRYTTVYRKGGK